MEKQDKNSIEIIKQMIADGQIAQDVAEKYFPELKESEDEKIRKWCISHFMECFSVTKDNVEYQEYLNNKVIPWLEKQGKQEPVVPKFKVGDTVKIKTTNDLVFTIKEITDNLYIDTNDGKYDIEGQDILELVEQKPVEWDEENERMLRAIIVALDIISKEKGHNYCYIKDSSGKIFADDIKNWLKSLKDRALPQPKQEWSEEDEYQYNTILHKLNMRKYVHEKEGNEELAKRYEVQYNWLKSLKDKCLPQPKQEWSEEDKSVIEEVACILLGDLNRADDKAEEERLKQLADKIQSLRPQEQCQVDSIKMQKEIDTIFNAIDKAKEELRKGNNGAALEALCIQYSGIPIQSQWKPTKEQLYWLKQVIPTFHNDTVLTAGMEVLSELYCQLKAL